MLTTPPRLPERPLYPIGLAYLHQNRLANIFSAIVSAGLFFLFIAVALWFIYSMSEAVKHEGKTHHEAVLRVSQMALVTTGLACSILVIVTLFAKSASIGKAAFRNALATGAILVGYTVLNVIWRNGWQPNSQRAAFLPPWSDLNAYFFYEYNWLSYLLFLTPLAMIATVGVSLLFAKLAFYGTRGAL